MSRCHLCHLITICYIGGMAIAIDRQLIQIVLEMIAQCSRSISLRLFSLQIAYHLVDGTPCSNILGWCLMFYLHVVLADIGDIKTEVVTKAHEKMTVFLALMLHLLDNTYRTYQGTAENTDGVVLLDEVAISFIYNAQSLNAFGYLVTEIHETFHIFIRNPRLFHDIIQCSGFTVGTKDMRLSKKGSLYDFITSRTIINTLIHEVAILGKYLFQTPFTLHSDKE